MQKIVPALWFNGNAVEGGQLYERAFENATSHVEASYPTEGLPDFQREMAGLPLIVAIHLGDCRITLINAGSEFRPNPAASLMLNFDPNAFDGDQAAARAALDRAWDVLSDGGTIRMPLGEYPFSPRYGWVEDQFGVNWQLSVTTSEGEPRPFVIPSLLYISESESVARQAVEFYVDTFSDSQVGTMMPRPDNADALMFCDFQIEGCWFTAMDGSSRDHAYTFTPGVSFEVHCENQAEIDRLWDALTAVPEAEACGWLADRFGVSWQIVPANMAELMARPDAYQHMLQMKKLVIADF